jgi:sortase (surface protein transpeptidase)
VLAALALVASVAVGSVVALEASPASAALPLPGGVSKYLPTASARLADGTRPASSAAGYSRPTSTSMRVRVRGRFGVPAGATAVVVNVTALNSKRPSTVSVFPTGDRAPSESNIVIESAGHSISNLVTVKLGKQGMIDLRHTAGVKVVVDMVGVYVGVTTSVAAGRLLMPVRGTITVAKTVPVAPKKELVIDLAKAGVPVGSVAAVLSLKVEHGGKGSWTVYPAGSTRPSTWSLVIDKAGTVRTNQTIVRLNGKNNKIRVYSVGGGRVTADVVGWYSGPRTAASSQGLFIATPHLKRLDNRTGHTLPPLGPVTLTFSPGTALHVQAVAANIVISGAWNPGSITAKPAGVTSSAVVAGSTSVWPQSVASHFIARTSTRGVALTSKIGAYMIVHVEGFFFGDRPKATLPSPKNRAYPSAPVDAVRWTDSKGTHTMRVLVAPSTKTDLTVLIGKTSSRAAAYKDLAKLYKVGNVMIFGHRTTGPGGFFGKGSVGGPFRFINTIPVGSSFSLHATNGHWYHYEVMYRGVTGAFYRSISAISRLFPPVTAQLVACSRADGSPTDLKWRFTVTGRLVSVT